MQVSEVVAIVMRRWFLVLAAVAAAFSMSLAIYGTAPDRYRTSADLAVGPNQELRESGDVEASLSTLNATRSALVATFVDLAMSQTIRNEAAAGTSLTSDEVDEYSVEAVALPESNVARITIVGPDPVVVVGLAEALSSAVSTVFGDLYGPFGATLVDLPTAPEGPDESGLAVMIGVSVVVAVALTVLFLVALEVFRPGAETTRSESVPAGGSGAA